MSQRGYWATHKYSRRKVEDIEEFVGWDYIEQLKEKVEARFGFEKAALPCFLMEGGFRIGELVKSSDGKVFGGLRKQNIMVLENRGMIAIRNAQRLKGYEKIRTYYQTVTEEELPTNKLRRLFIKDDKSGLYIRKRFETRPLIQARSFAFPIDEPLVKTMLDYLKEWKDDVLFSFTATRAYQILTEVDSKIWNHWFRAQRSSQLVAEYDFNSDQLMRFFEWKDEKTARRYARKGVGDVIKMFPPSNQVTRIRKPMKLKVMDE